MDGNSAWGLIAAYWLHMLATVAWVGSIFALSILVIPAARRTLSSEQYSGLLAHLSARLQQIGWFSLLVLFGTGMFQMISHPNYGGFFAIENSWSVAILAKHLVIGLMILSSSVITWGVMPQLQRLALLQSAGKGVDPQVVERLRRRETIVLQANLVLSILVLALTAVARAA